MNQVRHTFHFLSLLLQLVVLLVIERFIGMPLVSLVWVDMLRTRLHWPGQVTLWLAVSVLTSWIFAWPLVVSASLLLAYWAVALSTGHKCKLLCIVQALYLVAGYWYLKAPLSPWFLCGVLGQGLGAYVLWRNDQH